MSQPNNVLSHLTDVGSITALEALGLYGVFRLAARIFDLRKQGHDIITEVRRDHNGKSYARYVYAA